LGDEYSGYVAKKAETVPLIDFVIINTPAWLFLLFALAASICIEVREGPCLIMQLVFIWWSLCGAVMLLIDFYNRKRSLYLRLRLLLNDDHQKRVVHSLKQTPCGYAVYAAAVRYSRVV